MTTKDWLPAYRLKALSKRQTWKSLALILMDWAMIGATIWLSQKFWHPATYVFAVMLIANRQHGLLILMHDASHFRISGNKRLNDVVGEGLTAWPLFIRMKAYRERHLSHHKYSNSELDPDFRPERYPETRKEILVTLLRDGLALNTVEQFKEIARLKTKTSGTYRALRISFYVVLLAGVIFAGAGKTFLLYWIVPCFTWLKVILRLRSIADHTGVQHRDKPYDTRTIVPTFLDRVFLAPHYSSYHLGHHVYASVPCYNLKRLHHEIMKNPAVARNAHVTPGFRALLLEFPWDESQLKRAETNTRLKFREGYPRRAVLPAKTRRRAS
jgi:fatty acid desaturase